MAPCCLVRLQDAEVITSQCAVAVNSNQERIDEWIFTLRCPACFPLVCFVWELTQNIYTFIDSPARAGHEMMNNQA